MKKIIITLVIVAFAFGTIGAVTFFASPGDSSDPIITLSYIEDILKGQLSFKVVNLDKGDVLIGDQGAELVLRMGSAKIIATEKGGLADLTDGYDLANGTAMPSNHHLVVPVDDGRGIEAQNTVIVLVKGDYKIK